jgi:hypothetical protein
VLTYDERTADALGFCDAECVDVAGMQRTTVLHREYVGAPWMLVSACHLAADDTAYAFWRVASHIGTTCTASSCADWV